MLSSLAGITEAAARRGSPGSSSTTTMSRQFSESSQISDFEDDIILGLTSRVSDLAVHGDEEKHRSIIAQFQRLVECLQLENLNFRQKIGEQGERISSLEADQQENQSKAQHLNWQLGLRLGTIDELKAALHASLGIEPKLRIEMERLKSILMAQTSDLEQTRKSLEWYKSQFHGLQLINKSNEERICEKEMEISKQNMKKMRLQAEMRKVLSHCEMIEQRSVMEKAKMLQRIEDISSRPESKDSGIYSELLNDFSSNGNCPEIIELTSELSAATDELQDCKEKLDLQIQYTLKLNQNKTKLDSEIKVLQNQMQIKDDLFRLQSEAIANLNKNSSSMRMDLENKITEVLALKQKTADTQQKFENLVEENVKLNRLSNSMLERFSDMSSVVSDIRKQLIDKDIAIAKLKTRVPLSDSSSQTTVKTGLNCDQGVQVVLASDSESDEDKLKYYKSLLKVMDREYGQKLKQREINMRTLLRTVKTRIKSAKVSERKLYLLEQSVLDSILKVNPFLIGASQTVEEVFCLFIQDYEKLKHIPSSQSLQEKVELDNMQRNISVLRQSLTGKEEELLTLYSRLSQSKADIETKAFECEYLNGHLKELKQLNIRLQSNARDKQETIDSLSCRLEETKGDLSQKSFQLIKSSKHITDLEVSVDSLKSLHSSQEVERGEILSHLCNCQTELSKLNEEKLALVKYSNHLQAILNNFLNQSKDNSTTKSRALELLEKCAKNNATLNPLEECVESLREEMHTLNTTIKRNRLFRREVSLMEELQAVGL